MQLNIFHVITVEINMKMWMLHWGSFLWSKGGGFAAQSHTSTQASGEVEFGTGNAFGLGGQRQHCSGGRQTPRDPAGASGALASTITALQSGWDSSFPPKFIDFILCVQVFACLPDCVPCLCRAHGVQRRAPGALELDLQMVASCHVGARTAGRAASVLSPHERVLEVLTSQFSQYVHWQLQHVRD